MMDAKRIVLNRIKGGEFIALRPDRNELIAELNEHYGLPIHDAKRAIAECLQEGLISHLYNRYTITQEGLDFLNNKYSKEHITPINTQLNLSQGVRLAKWLKVTFWTIALGVIGSLIDSAIWDKL